VVQKPIGPAPIVIYYYTGWWSSKGKGSFRNEFGASHCNQRRLCCIVVRERRALFKLFWGVIVITSPSVEVRSIAISIVCMSVCLRAYLKNQMSKLHQIFRACCLWRCSRPSSAGGITTCYVFPVLWLTLCLHVMACRQKRSEKGIYALTHQEEAPEATSDA